MKQRDESLATLADDLEQLGRMAYPDASMDVQNALSQDQFIDALPDDDMRLRIKQERPKTLQRALELSLELESFQLASKHPYYRTSREQLHGSTTSRHFGVKKTLQRLKQKFYWPQCREDVKRWCKKCDECSSKKGPSQKPKAPLKLYAVGEPMERIAIDIMGPLPTTKKGNKY